MVVMKRKRPGDEYDEDEKLLHQVRIVQIRSLFNGCQINYDSPCVSIVHVDGRFHTFNTVQRSTGESEYNMSAAASNESDLSPRHRLTRQLQQLVVSMCRRGRLCLVGQSERTSPGTDGLITVVSLRCQDLRYIGRPSPEEAPNNARDTRRLKAWRRPGQRVWLWLHKRSQSISSTFIGTMTIRRLLHTKAGQLQPWSYRQRRTNIKSCSTYCNTNILVHGRSDSTRYSSTSSC